MGIYVFSRQVLLDVLEQDGIDFGKEIIPQALGQYSVNAFLHRGYWADVGTIGAYYDANIMLTRPDAPFRFHDPRRPIFTHPRQLPPARFSDCTIRDSAHQRRLLARSLHDHRLGRRRADGWSARGCRISRSVLVGADLYETEEEALGLGDTPRLGIGRDVVDRPRNRRQERAHRRRVPARQREGRSGGRRRRLAHPLGHRRRAEERRRETGHGGIAQARCCVPGAECGAGCLVLSAGTVRACLVLSGAPGTWHMAPHKAPRTEAPVTSASSHSTRESRSASRVLPG